MNGDPTNGLLGIATSAAVPLIIAELTRKGGPDDADIRDAAAFGQVLAEKGDNLLYRSPRKGETAELFNRLSRSLAVMAFAPGGVVFCGNRFEALPGLTKTTLNVEGKVPDVRA